MMSKDLLVLVKSSFGWKNWNKPNGERKKNVPIQQCGSVLKRNEWTGWQHQRAEKSTEDN